ncbi:uncharacterized protein LOC110610681 isoform X1 [Manihot esculenta]|uniref:Uncharacterized protein n=4 Tax=Manihot esculenta TaxID=3983 RepID=A0ACB7I0C0_MANES|nr:uncharacterized protein LOC110610681 isoform X1 [Manihot esculenta]XP_043811462.1 uncharacterized protein LOC110610681 isoform X1 [Manihot esculenta]KAG8657927.1 hypothetical protein MANES_03G103501v8 [Manihot esculenta]KAG8657928.1 hypothetical protein MANES_03G103501v8 [Manihot esculenta]KAG8657929.1 hypothetical protein MANES_03G103501v8 [Manihot esculenta]KAG8657930.1 hypothetical protein MANES_03G103501v8 [Manihot esculenta]
MDQEEETQKCGNSNNNGGGCGVNIGNIGRSSKKQKQKKVPQRGLGVAQLEKIRLEEQQKKDGSTILTSASSSPPPPKPSNLSPSVPIPNYQSYSASSASSPNSILRPQNIDTLVHSLGWQSVSVQGHGNMPKLWNSCDFNLEKDTAYGIHPELSFRSSFNLPFQSNSIWPLPSLMQRAQYQPPLPPAAASSMVNVPSSSSSSLQILHVELPSNQSYYGNYTPIWPEEENVVGLKRPYPFALDNPPGPSFPCKFPPVVRPIGRSDESASFANGGTFNFIPANSNFREGPSCSNSISEPKPNSKKIIDGFSSGDFLTLGLPTATSTRPNSNLKPPSASLAIRNYGNFDFDSLPYQGSMEDPSIEQEPSVPNQLQHYCSFLPPATVQIGQPAKTISNCSGDEVVEENLDLSLKL